MLADQWFKTLEINLTNLLSQALEDGAGQVRPTLVMKGVAWKRINKETQCVQVHVSFEEREQIFLH